MPSITVPENYGWVTLAAASYLYVNIYQSNVVSSKRKAAKVLYPHTYAEKAQCDANKDAMVFNCAQRAHANTLEHLPSTLFATLFFGLRYPLAAAVIGGVHSIGRVLYTIGYATGDPKKRTSYGGALGPLTEYGLTLAATWAAVEMIMGKW